MQVEQIVDAWKSEIVHDNLVASHVPANVSHPFELQPHDVAERRAQEALMWSKVLPFVLFIWALTGAFYPAVDLCAGEKERGTLETLLSSPAARTEIVWGKLLTVMTFSAATALLNLSSLGMTARYVMAQLSMMPIGDLGEGMQLPPLPSLLWLVVALDPHVRPIQRPVPRLCRVRPQHQRRPVLLNAAVPRQHAADDAPARPRHRTKPRQQPHSDHRRRAARDELVTRRLRRIPPLLHPSLRSHAHLLPLGHPLGRLPIQPRIGAVPRKRTPRSAALDSATHSRTPRHALAAGSVLRRRADFRHPILHAIGDLSERTRRTKLRLPGIVTIHQPGRLLRAPRPADGA